MTNSNLFKFNFTEAQFIQYDKDSEVPILAEHFWDWLAYDLNIAPEYMTEVFMLNLQLAFLSELSIRRTEQIKSLKKHERSVRIKGFFLRIQTSVLFWIADVFNVQDPLVEKLRFHSERMRAERDNTNLLKNFKF